MSTKVRGIFVVAILASVCVVLSGGCRNLEYHKIYMTGLAGAAVGAIVGHQSDECGAGAGVGAAVFAVGELLHQVDEMPREKKMEKAADEVARGDSLLDEIGSGQ
jgi:hypothetical protein